LAQSKSYNGVVTLMVTAAIAYGDAIATKIRGIVNQHDLQNTPWLLREVLSNRPPDRQEKCVPREQVDSRRFVLIDIQMQPLAQAHPQIVHQGQLLGCFGAFARQFFEQYTERPDQGVHKELGCFLCRRLDFVPRRRITCEQPFEAFGEQQVVQA